MEHGGGYSLAIEEFDRIPNYKFSNQRNEFCQVAVQYQSEDKAPAEENLKELLLNATDDVVIGRICEFLSSWDENGIPVESLLRILSYIKTNGIWIPIDYDGLFLEAHLRLLPALLDFVRNGQELFVLTEDYRILSFEMLEDSVLPTIPSEANVKEKLLLFAERLSDGSIDHAFHCYSNAFSMDPSVELLDEMAKLADSLPLGLGRLGMRREIAEKSKILPNEGSHYREVLEKETIEVVANYGRLGLSSLDVMKLVKFSRENSIEAEGSDVDSIYRNAALSLIHFGVVDYEFGDWDHDGIDELLVLAADNNLYLYDLAQEWGASYSFDVGPGKEGMVLLCNGLYACITTEAGDGFNLFSLNNGVLKEVSAKSGIKGLEIEENRISFSEALPGSVERIEELGIELKDSAVSCSVVAVDWGQERYVLPNDGESAVRRWLETLLYNIPQERILLEVDGATLDVPRPLALDSIEVRGYFNEGSLSYVLARYQSVEGPLVVLSFECVSKGDACVVSSIEAIEKSIGNIGLVLSMNKEAKGVLHKKNECLSYTLIIPNDSRINLLWQSGDVDGSSARYSVSLFEDGTDAEPVFHYEMSASRKLQKTYPSFLEKGVYKMDVRALSDNPLGYGMTVEACTVENIEKEPNDNHETATPVSFDNEYCGSLRTSADKDYYRFSIDDNSRVSIQVLSPEDGNKKDKFSISVYDAESRKTIHNFKISGVSDGVRSGNLYLGGGEYLVLVEKGDYFSQDEYRLMVSASSGTVQEIEDNDSRKSATEVKLGVRTYGSLSMPNDIDWYAFDIQSPMIVRSFLSFSPIGSSSKAYIVSLFGNEGEIAQWSVSGNSRNVDLNPMLLGKGKYYIRIEGVQYNPKDYSLLLEGECAELIEEEPNNNPSTATNLPVGMTMTGFSADITDIDCYKVSLEKGTYLIEFECNAKKASPSLCSFSIEREGVSLYRQSIKGSSGGFSNVFGFEAGEYILRIQPSCEIGDVYSLRVSNQ